MFSEKILQRMLKVSACIFLTASGIATYDYTNIHKINPELAASSLNTVGQNHQTSGGSLPYTERRSSATQLKENCFAIVEHSEPKTFNTIIAVYN